MLSKYIYLGLFCWLLVSPVFAQETNLPRCGERRFIQLAPRADPNVWCMEHFLSTPEYGEQAFTDLAYGADGTLYATRPRSGELIALTDSDGDQLPDTQAVVADGMQLPNGLVADGDTLYILGDGFLYRYQAGILRTLLDDLPTGRGFMARAITLHDNKLYLGIPMPCDFCEGDHPYHGTVISYDLVSGEITILARGLRYPTSLNYFMGYLWVTDTARNGATSDPLLDEINRIDLNDTQIPHFGFPYCIGARNLPDFVGDFDCSRATAPSFIMDTQSMPFDLAPYQGIAYPNLQDELLLIQAGSGDFRTVLGYQMLTLDLFRPDATMTTETIAPSDLALVETVAFPVIKTWIQGTHGIVVNRRGAGFYPHQLYAVVVSPEGWIIIAVGGGSLYVIRPNSESPCDFRECP